MVQTVLKMILKYSVLFRSENVIVNLHKNKIELSRCQSDY